METNRIIIYDGKKEIAEAETALIQRRAKIAEALEACRVAMDKFLERPTDFEDLEPFFETKNEEARKELAIKLWLSKTRQTVPALSVKLTTVIITPTEVTELLKVFQNYKEMESQDPKRYWDEQHKVFAAMPISKEDKDIITERSRVYCAPKVDPELGKFAFQLVQLINYGNTFYNRYGGGTSPLETPNSTFQHFLKPLLVAKRHTPLSEHSVEGVWEYALKPGLFTQNGSNEKAFDEKPVIRGNGGFKPLALHHGLLEN